jgi:methylene-tetrahydromethanopterin dehydrogenase
MTRSPHILHMLTPLKHMSPFDVNMAADAGYDVIVPYSDVTIDEIAGLVQDAIFSRPPSDGVKTAMFIAGKNAITALDMVEAARAAMVPPFVISVFADPAGSFTTAAAMVACVERTLQRRFQRGLAGARIAIFGATGVVGFSSAVIAALEGAKVTLVGRGGVEHVKETAAAGKARFNVDLAIVDGTTDAMKRDVAANADVVLCAAAAGKRVLDAGHLSAASQLLVVADVNAVPPSGVEGLGVSDDAKPLPGSTTLGIGPLAIGNVKYKTESGLFRQMIEATKPVSLDFRDAFVLARKLVSE